MAEDNREAAVTDETWFELWRCRSLDELRLKAAVLGLDEEEWLRTDGYMWIPKDDYNQVLWYDRDELAEAP